MGRATGIGVPAGLFAFFLWPFDATYREPLLWLFGLLLATAALCGISILSITALDMLLVKRSDSVRPVRAFDLALGTLLALPATIELRALWDQLWLFL